MTREIKWSIDQSHSEVLFLVRHFMIADIIGAFKIFDASIYTSSKDFTTAEINFWIDVASITTKDGVRDEQLKSSGFFDVKNYNQIKFYSNTIGQADENGHHELLGELTMKGIAKKVKLNVQFKGILNGLAGNNKSIFKVTGEINRSDWGLIWPNSMGSADFMISDEIEISCEIELVNVNQQNLMEMVSSEDEKAIN